MNDDFDMTQLKDAVTSEQQADGALNKEDFTFAEQGDILRDTKLKTKPVGYFRDAWRRFKKNKASLVALGIIVFLILFAIFVPLAAHYGVGFSDSVYRNRIPKNNALAKIGIATGTYEKTINRRAYEYYTAIGIATTVDMATGSSDAQASVGGEYSPIRSSKKTKDGKYAVKLDAYYEIGFRDIFVTADEYDKIKAYEKQNNIHIIYPVIDDSQNVVDKSDPNYWYVVDPDTGYASKDAQGNFVDAYKRDSEGNFVDFLPRDITSRQIRVLYCNYFYYVNGEQPQFLFGTNSVGQDILARLAYGIRLSLLLSVCVSVINLLIGAIYGTIEGYYGGTIDLVMERIVDILSGVPFIIVATLFQLHLAKSAGVIPSLLFAFVLTGWIGTARRVRSQFYRFKRQEYVLAARTLGAGDGRLMFRHIFPNTLGTIITSSVLVIPNVIFSESMLSYLGIVNLSGSETTSIGTMLSEGQAVLAQYPHVILYPAVVVSLLMISFNLFGNGLRDAFNPALRGVEE